MNNEESSSELAELGTWMADLDRDKFQKKHEEIISAISLFDTLLDEMLKTKKSD